jgi:hypothetical protein
MVLKDSTKISIIGCLWRANPQLVTKGFIEANKDTSHLIRISTICSELKVLYGKAHYMDRFSIWPVPNKKCCYLIAAINLVLETVISIASLLCIMNNLSFGCLYWDFSSMASVLRYLLLKSAVNFLIF